MSRDFAAYRMTSISACTTAMKGMRHCNDLPFAPHAAVPRPRPEVHVMLCRCGGITHMAVREPSEALYS